MKTCLTGQKPGRFSGESPKARKPCWISVPDDFVCRTGEKTRLERRQSGKNRRGFQNPHLRPRHCWAAGHRVATGLLPLAVLKQPCFFYKVIIVPVATGLLPLAVLKQEDNTIQLNFSNVATGLLPLAVLKLISNIQYRMRKSCNRAITACGIETIRISTKRN